MKLISIGENMVRLRRVLDFKSRKGVLIEKVYLWVPECTKIIKIKRFNLEKFTAKVKDLIGLNRKSIWDLDFTKIKRKDLLQVTNLEKLKEELLKSNLI